MQTRHLEDGSAKKFFFERHAHVPLCANMREMAGPSNISVEGEETRYGRSVTRFFWEPSAEAPEKPTRRSFDAAYKLRIPPEAEGYIEPGQLGELLRREGLFASHLSPWRKAREQGSLQGLSQRRRGRKANQRDARDVELERLRRQNQRLEQRLKQSEMIIEVQKKLLSSWESPGVARQRQQLIVAAEQLSLDTGVRLACRVLGVPRAKFHRRQRPKHRVRARRCHPRQLCPQERQQVRQYLYSEACRDLPVSKPV